MALNLEKYKKDFSEKKREKKIDISSDSYKKERPPKTTGIIDKLKSRVSDIIDPKEKIESRIDTTSNKYRKQYIGNVEPSDVKIRKEPEVTKKPEEVEGRYRYRLEQGWTLEQAKEADRLVEEGASQIEAYRIAKLGERKEDVIRGSKYIPKQAEKEEEEKRPKTLVEKIFGKKKEKTTEEIEDEIEPEERHKEDFRRFKRRTGKEEGLKLSDIGKGGMGASEYATFRTEKRKNIGRVGTAKSAGISGVHITSLGLTMGAKDPMRGEVVGSTREPSVSIRGGGHAPATNIFGKPQEPDVSMGFGRAGKVPSVKLGGFGISGKAPDTNISGLGSAKSPDLGIGFGGSKQPDLGGFGSGKLDLGIGFGGAGKSPDLGLKTGGNKPNLDLNLGRGSGGLDLSLGGKLELSLNKKTSREPDVKFGRNMFDLSGFGSQGEPEHKIGKTRNPLKKKNNTFGVEDYF